MLHRDRPLRIIANRHARNPKAGRFLLDAARVRQHQPRVLHQAEKIHVTERIDQADLLLTRPRVRLAVAFEPKLLDALPCARVNRKDDGQLLAQLRKAFEDLPKSLPVVHVCGAMKRQQDIGPNRTPAAISASGVVQTELVENRRCISALGVE